MRTGLSRHANGSLSVGIKFAGKGFARARDRAAFLPRKSAVTGSRDRKCRSGPREWRGNLGGLPETAGNRICVALGGGAGRTQTCNQAIMRPELIINGRRRPFAPRLGRQDYGPTDMAPPAQALSRWHRADRSRQ
jgi:hypothetical protein